MLELKKGNEIIFAVDRSGSMVTRDCDGDTRYNAVRETIKAFVLDAAKFDANGVSVYLFNNHVDAFPDVSAPEQVDALITKYQAGGGTRTDLAISAAYAEHVSKKSSASFLVIFTDGEPTDPQAVKDSIVTITNKMRSPEEFRILFLTVGQRTPELSQFLADLDSNLPAKFDIVGVEELAGVDFEQAIADLIGSSTTEDEAAAGQTAGKKTERV